MAHRDGRVTRHDCCRSLPSFLLDDLLAARVHLLSVRVCFSPREYQSRPERLCSLARSLAMISCFSSGREKRNEGRGSRDQISTIRFLRQTKHTTTATREAALLCAYAFAPRVVRCLPVPLSDSESRASRVQADASRASHSPASCLDSHSPSLLSFLPSSYFPFQSFYLLFLFASSLDSRSIAARIPCLRVFFPASLAKRADSLVPMPIVSPDPGNNS